MGKMLGGDEEKDPDAAKKEEERQEALRQAEEERKAKYAKMEAEREAMRQGIRDKVRAGPGPACWEIGPESSGDPDPAWVEGAARRRGGRPPGSPPLWGLQGGGGGWGSDWVPSVGPSPSCS